jgi:hypothetical protein
MTKSNHSTRKARTTRALPAPGGLSAKAGGEKLSMLIRFCKGKPFSRPCLVLDAAGGFFVKI